MIGVMNSDRLLIPSSSMRECLLSLAIPTRKIHLSTSADDGCVRVSDRTSKSIKTEELCKLNPIEMPRNLMKRSIVYS
jgi:hypothetical protein